MMDDLILGCRINVDPHAVQVLCTFGSVSSRLAGLNVLWKPFPATRTSKRLSTHAIGGEAASELPSESSCLDIQQRSVTAWRASESSPVMGHITQSSETCTRSSHSYHTSQCTSRAVQWRGLPCHHRPANLATTKLEGSRSGQREQSTTTSLVTSDTSHALRQPRIVPPLSAILPLLWYCSVNSISHSTEQPHHPAAATHGAECTTAGPGHHHHLQYRQQHQPTTTRYVQSVSPPPTRTSRRGPFPLSALPFLALSCLLLRTVAVLAPRPSRGRCTPHGHLLTTTPQHFSHTRLQSPLLLQPPAHRRQEMHAPRLIRRRGRSRSRRSR